MWTDLFDDTLSLGDGVFVDPGSRLETRFHRSLHKGISDTSLHCPRCVLLHRRVESLIDSVHLLSGQYRLTTKSKDPRPA